MREIDDRDGEGKRQNWTTDTGVFIGSSSKDI